MTKVLLVESRPSGRQSAIAHKLESHGHEVFIASRSGAVQTGMLVGESIFSTKNAQAFFEKLVAAVEKIKPDLIVPSSEDILDAGIADVFRQRGYPVFGPSLEAMWLEASKVDAKKAMNNAGVPTADYRTFQTAGEYEALRYVKDHFAVYPHKPLVIKRKGLAYAQGVRVCHTPQEANGALHRYMRAQGDSVVVEEYLDGDERSMHAFCDGTNYYTVPFFMRDYKWSHEGDQGDLTGSMATVARAPHPGLPWTPVIGEKIIGRMFDYLKWRGISPIGCLYPGLKVGEYGLWRVLEYNWRFGDSECQVMCALLRSDLFSLMYACAVGRLSEAVIEWHPGHAVCINLVSRGYPGTPQTGFPISGLEEASQVEGVTLHWAGMQQGLNKLLTAGGRVISIVAWALRLEDAISNAYLAAELVKYEGKRYRGDIGADVLMLNGPT